MLSLKHIRFSRPRRWQLSLRNLQLVECRSMTTSPFLSRRSAPEFVSKMFIVLRLIDAELQGTQILTEHQREVRREQKQNVLSITTYTDLEGTMVDMLIGSLSL